jgi:hypothetical protein
VPGIDREKNNFKTKTPFSKILFATITKIAIFLVSIMIFSGPLAQLVRATDS